MLIFLGDLHRAGSRTFWIIDRANDFLPTPIPVIQVGDLEWHPDKPPPRSPWPIYWIDGNHDHLPSLLPLRTPTEVWPGWIYCPRGSVLEVGGYRIGFLGGARSLHRSAEVEGRSWWAEEEPTREEASRLNGQDIDVLVTHTPPAFVVQAMGFRRDREERASAVVQELWTELGSPLLVCGHMHQSFQLDGVRVLGMREAVVLRNSSGFE